MAELIPITSEALQATIRRLLPSQRGFGEDLQATNVITPVINVTSTAEGSQLPTDLARSFSFGSITEWESANNTVTIANTPGFYRVFGTLVQLASAPNSIAEFTLTDTVTTKHIWKTVDQSGTDADHFALNFNINVFLDTGITLQATTSSFEVRLTGCSWQIADRYGNLNNPSGFTFE